MLSLQIDHRRLWSILVIMILVCYVFFVMVAVPAQAVAVELALGVGCTVLVIAVLATMGLTFRSNGIEGVQDWLQPKLTTYATDSGYESISDWLGVSTIGDLFLLSAGKGWVGAGILNKILQFAREWFVDEGIQSGGPVIGSLGAGVAMTSLSSSGWYGTMSGVGIADNQLQVTYTNAGGTIYPNGTSGGHANLIIYIEDPATTYTISCVSRNMESGSWASAGIIPAFSSSGTGVQSSSSPVLNATGQSVTVSNPNRYHYLRFLDYTTAVASLRTTGTMIINVSGTNDFYEDGSFSIEPGSTVTIPNDLPMGQMYGLGGDAFRTATSPDDALQNVVDDLSTADGYTADPGTVDGYEVPEDDKWLYVPITEINDALQDISGMNVNGPKQSPGLTTVFPFCIPWDIYHFFEALAADPTPPRFEATLRLPAAIGGDQTIVLDFNSTTWNTLAQILRTMELLAFCVGLAVITRHLIRG